MIYPAFPHHLACLQCGRASPPSLELRCPECRGLFRVEYHEPPRPYEPRTPWFSISLRQGWTSLMPLPLAGGFTAKLEFLSPTGSFKDRGAAMLIGGARAFKLQEFVEDSSGNAGAALSAYAAAAGIQAHIFLPASAPPVKRAQIEAVGGIAHPVEGPRAAAAEAAQRFADTRRLPFLSHNLSPYFAEGMKSLAWELTSQLIGVTPDALPDHIILPVGNGSLLLGLWRGFQELREVGKADRIPRLHAAQSESVAPLVAALNDQPPSAPAPTVADGIAIPNPPRLAEMTAAVRESNGAAIAVSEDAILEAQRQLGRTGLWCEPTSAVPIAALKQLRRDGTVQAEDTVIIPLTGHGLKAAVS